MHLNMYIYLKNLKIQQAIKQISSEQKRIVMNNGKKALQSIVNERKQMKGSDKNNNVSLLNDPTMASNIAKYLMTQLHDRSSVKY